MAIDHLSEITLRCRICGKTSTAVVSTQGLRDWANGALIQNALPELSPEQRELLISSLCSTCFDKLFAEE